MHYLMSPWAGEEDQILLVNTSSLCRGREDIEAVWLIDLLQLLEGTMRQIQLLPLLLLPTLFSCDTTDPPPQHEPSIQLSAEDVSCTEAWLKVSLTDVSEPRTVAIQQDGQRVSVSTLLTPDSLIVVEGLLPRRTYTFLAQRLAQDSSVVSASLPAQATTMDTTSHNFAWQIDTLGVTSSSLNDVAIINDTLAYAAGEMYLRDSTGGIDPTRYNLAVWNGTRWSIRRLAYYFQGQPFYHPIQTVFALNANDIWFAGNGVSRWNGQRFIEMPIPSSVWVPNRMNKIWGSSSSDIYIVGDNGSIAHFNGSTWQRVESGTTLTMRDIWGAPNPRSGHTEILALASTFEPQTQESRILNLTGITVAAVSNTGLHPYLNGIWFVPGGRYYAVGAGIHQKRLLNDSLWRAYPSGVVTRFSSGGVRGQNLNDVFVVGSFGEVVHFNGFSWYRYFSDVPLPSGAYGSVASRGNLMMAAGDIGATRAIVLIGRR
jgi:hypothetical protein